MVLDLKDHEDEPIMKYFPMVCLFFLSRFLLSPAKTNPCNFIYYSVL